MKIQTKFFGEIDIDGHKILNFKHGIPGFEGLKKFILLDIEENEYLKCLQSIEDKNISFLVTSPWNYFKDYEIELSGDEIKELDINDERNVMIYNIVTVRENKITTNLVAPVVVNVINNRAKQIILSNTKYNIRQEIACL